MPHLLSLGRMYSLARSHRNFQRYFTRVFQGIVTVSFVHDHEEVPVGLTLENVKFHWLSPHTLNFGCGPSRHGTEMEYCQGLNQSPSLTNNLWWMDLLLEKRC